MTVDQLQLIEYFTESRPVLLAPTNEQSLGDYIVRIALSDPSGKANPVLHAVFALACLKLGDTTKGVAHKRRVMSMVRESDDWLDSNTLLCNLMATMLLYQYEASQDQDSKGDWVTFLCAVKNVINTSPAMHKLIKHEFSEVLNWIYYHEVLGEFTIRHWKVPYEGCGWAPVARSPEAKVASGPGVIDMLQLLTYTCRQSMAKNPARMEGLHTISELRLAVEQNLALDSELRTVYVQSAMAGMNRNDMIANLHRFASLIYANRATSRVLQFDFHHKRLVSEAMMLLDALETCQHGWPLFIVACEAVDDDQRQAILRIFEQTRQDRGRRSNHVNLIQYLVEAVWKQQDLAIESDIDHLAIIDAVVHSIPFIPLFA